MLKQLYTKQLYLNSRLVDALSVLAAIAGYGVYFWMTRYVWSVPEGARIKSMGSAMWELGVALGTLFMVYVFAGLGRPRSAGQPPRLRELALWFSCLLPPLCFVYIPAVAALRGVRL